jgi:hypothetical protein
MKLIIFTFLLLASVQTAYAFNPVSPKPEVPYEPILVTGDPYVEQEFLGILENFPVMYELTSDITFDLKIKLRQLAEDNPFPLNLIVVRDDTENGGVIEMARLNQETDKWQTVSDSLLAMDFLESREVTLNVPPGTYRIEVSTPDNIGSYMMIIGEEPTRVGYFKTLANIRETHNNFGYTVLHMVLTPYVYYPLGILILLWAFYYLRRYKKLHYDS